jgi:signal transduction histidine kinase
VEQPSTDLRGRYRAIADLGLLALAEHPRAQLFDGAVGLVREALNADFAKILEIQPQGTLLVTAGAGWPPGIVGEFEVPDDGNSLASYALQQGVPVLVEDLPAERRFTPHPVFLELGVASGVSVVIEGTQQPYGVLEVDAREPRAYQAEAVDFLQLVGNVLGSAIDREQREEARERFVSAVSHEIRNPLTSVVGFSRRLMRALEPGATISADVYAELEILDDQVGRLNRAVDLVFQLDRLDRPAALIRDRVAIGPLVQGIMNEMRARYPLTEFVEDMRQDIEVSADPAAVRTAFRTLIDNAARYSDRLSSRVEVALRAEAAGTTLTVRDSCGGLTDEELGRLFEQGYRGQNRNDASGLGMGLYLARRVCIAFGWTIEVQNFPNDGCAFLIEIPPSSPAR